MIRGLNGKRLFSQYLDRSDIKKWIESSKDTGRRYTIFIDSGAYTAHTQGAEIKLDTYIDYLNAHQGYFQVIAPLDVIPDATTESKIQAPQKSWENYQTMKEKVKDSDNIIPVFHMGEDFKYLNMILNDDTKYMALGGQVGSSQKEKISWYEKCFQIIRKSRNPNIKIHAFGMTSIKLLEMYPFYSADSTSWLMCAANGSIMTKDGTIYVGNNFSDSKHINYMPAGVNDKIRAQCDRYGLQFDKLATDYKEREKFNLFYLQEWADNYTYKGKSTYRRSLF